MQVQLLETQLAKLMAALPGASIALSRQLKRQISELQAQLEAAKLRERSTDE